VGTPSISADDPRKTPLTPLSWATKCAIASITGLLPTVLYVLAQPSGFGFAGDFHMNIWDAGRDYLRGLSPLPPPTEQLVD
jgi:hypothetical protein